MLIVLYVISYLRAAFVRELNAVMPDIVGLVERGAG